MTPNAGREWGNTDIADNPWQAIPATRRDASDMERVSANLEIDDRMSVWWIRAENAGATDISPREWEASEDSGDILDIIGVTRSDDRDRYLKITTKLRR